MWTESAIPEAERHFLQRRVALYAMVMTAIALLASITHAALAPSDYVRGPGFATLVAGTLVAAAGALFCSTGRRSLGLLRVGEVLGLLVGAGVLGVVGREMSAIAPALVRDAGIGEALGRPFELLVEVIQMHVALGLTAALTYVFLVRAALIPSRPLRTLLLTALIGYPALVFMATGVLPFQEGWLVPTPASEAVGMPRAVDAGIWWVLTTGMCTVVSGIIYGLRREVRRAMQLGQYRLEANLGAGGMGIVYRAHHALLKRPTAIKLLPPGKAGATALARFEREVKLTARLTHPNTITIFDYGHTPDGVFYYAMELLEGATVDEIVRCDGAQPAERVIHVLTAVAGALEEAHGIGLIHRDIKPANIMLCQQGGRQDVPKLLDFGLVKDVSAEDDAALTREGDVAGTPLYMAPETLTSPANVDARSDIYAVGAVGYFLLTGQHVFTGKTLMEVCGHHLHTKPAPLSEQLGASLPEDLEALILRCLEKDPRRRPQSAPELSGCLEACRPSDAWTPLEARRWWEAHWPELQRDAAERAAPEKARTLEVDLRRSLTQLPTRAGPPP
jgi:serine/threonine-protein kinase